MARKRNAQKVIEDDYKSVFGLSKITRADDTVINNILETIRVWQGFFPGETADSVAVNREMDKRAVSGFPDGLIKHFSSLGLVNPEESDYKNLFMLYKDYIKNDPDGVNHPPAGIDSVKMSDKKIEVESERDDQNTTASEIQPQTSEDQSSNKNVPNIITKETERMKVADLMGGNTVQTASDILGATVAPQGEGTNVGATEAQSKAAARIAEQQVASRSAWSASHPIEKMIITHEPITRRLVDNKKTKYPIVNPEVRLPKIVEMIWKETGKETTEGLIDSYGTVKGELQVPQCVKNLGAENVENFKNFMTAMRQAVDDKNYEVEADFDYRFPGFKGVKLGAPVTENGNDSVFKWKDLKGIISTHAMASLTCAADSSVIVQQYNVTPKQLSKKKKISSLEDLVTIRVVNTNAAVDTKTGVVNTSLAAYAYEVTKDAADEPARNVRSKMRFSYEKQVSNADGTTSMRKTTVTANLIVPVLKEKLVAAEYSILKSGSIGGGTVAYTEDEKTDQVRAMMIAAMQYSIPDTQLNAAHAAILHEDQAADAAVAGEIAEDLD